MAYELMATELLVAETAALRIVVQRVLFQLAAQVGDPTEILRSEHEAALDDLSRINFVGASPEHDEAIRAHAQRVLDEIHTAMKPRPFR